MKNFKLNLVSAAAAVVMLGAAGGAQASAYALAANNIQDFNIITSPNVQFAASIDTSSTSALLNGNGAGPFGGTGVEDAQVANAPGSTPVRANNAAFAGNVINPVGQTATNYSYADALIQHGPGGGLPFNAYTIAESNLTNPGAASGTATNSSATGFRVNFSTTDGGVLDFRFFADPLIRTYLDFPIEEFAQGTLTANLAITCASETCGAGIVDGDTVFSWAPNGSVGGATGVTGEVGGNEIADAENLNISRSNFFGGPINYSSADNLGFYRAVTNQLAAGLYTLTLEMTSTDSTRKADVPEPASLALIGLGLGGLGLMGRRRQRKA